MRHVDALSRHSLPTAMLIEECQDSVWAKLRQNQSRDEELENIKKQIEEKRADEYTIVNRLICKEVDGETSIVVPKSMQTSLIRRVHERDYFACMKTEQLLKADY